VTTKIINLRDFSDELRRSNDDRLDEQRSAVANGIARSIPKLVESSPVDTGLYASSWDFTIGEKNAILGNFAPHAAIIENGARPFTPPIKPLLDWAKRVLKDPGQPPKYSPDVWSLARGVQRKIQREGMKPRSILEKAIPMVIDNIRSELKRLG